MRKKFVFAVMCALVGFSSLAPDVTVKAEGAGAPSTIPAFPGAEGGGMYASGGRGYDVYEVTNLNDSGPGSLRDAISSDNRMVVFRVSGTIHLSSSLSFSGRKNITVAGQTAPGDGIAVAGYNTDVSNANNIIIRYLRFRPGSANIHSEPDSLGGRGSNYLMIDHVSASWSTDETLSFYENNNMTVQWSLISESLTVSGHIKGKHGYGGIWGGNATSFHHNMFVNHTSRMPRLGNGTTPGTVTMANNVIYNWGFNNTYGGTIGLKSNVVNNYYKPGPSTDSSVKGRIINPGDGEFYINGNFMFGNPEASADNRKGIQDQSASTVISNAPFQDNGYNLLNVEDPQAAYNHVIRQVGAVLPKRDASDARIIQDVIDGTGRIINREYEVGGYPELRTGAIPDDTDHDGMPDAWEESHGLNKNDASDGKAITASGYSNLEIYLNSLVDWSYAPENPVVKVTTPTYNALYGAGGPIQVDVVASDADGITKVEFYKNDAKLGEDLEAPYSYIWEQAEEGTYYISARAYDNKGNATQSTSMPIHVNGPEVTAPWNSADIGSTPVQGSGSLDASGVLTVKGSGKITGTKDSLHFVYQPISGNAALTARLDSIALLDNNAISGLMIRESLEPDAAEAFISSSIVKADRDENMNGDKDDTYYATYFSTRMNKGEAVKTLDGAAYPQDYLPALTDHNLPIWLKIERVDNTVIAYTSTDGIAWKELARKAFAMGKEAYIGFAVDATQPSIANVYYNTAKFSVIRLTNSFTVSDVKITDISGKPVAGLTPGLNAVAAVTVNKNSSANQTAVIAIQLCDANDNVLGTSYVESPFSAGQTKTVKAGFSTPMHLEGLKIKAFVVNKMTGGMKISNEITVH
ncbi:Ig-like domain-containing protein [Paenibacillus silviterrae]|uniref:Ig-like domain-containing protein n=1 Tax=Paenibacillus silviterrae TaxID=3242194 RepID=UPI0025433040|nr:Ig-like domain-containing protein [Paenibacillus chinjuensis]